MHIDGTYMHACMWACIQACMFDKGKRKQMCTYLQHRRTCLHILRLRLSFLAQPRHWLAVNVRQKTLVVNVRQKTRKNVRFAYVCVYSMLSNHIDSVENRVKINFRRYAHTVWDMDGGTCTWFRAVTSWSWVSYAVLKGLDAHARLAAASPKLLTHAYTQC